MGKEVKEVIVTKYAVTTGMFRMMAAVSVDGYASQLPENKMGHFLSREGYALTEDEAIKKFEEARIKKLQSLDKQTKKLSAMKFSIDSCINPDEK